MVRVLICPTAFKGTLGAARAAAAMERGACRAYPDAEVRRMPLSDGGPGLLDALEASGAGSVREVGGVAGPAGGTVTGRVLMTDGGRTTVVESSDACGLHLLPPSERDPLRTHTRGVGELIRAAAAPAPDAVVVGLGGSGTCDGGAGAARVLGYRFLAADGGALPDGGVALADLDGLRLPSPAGGGPAEPTAAVELLALADVDNPLLGPRGAAATYAPQKGADRRDVERLEAGLERLVEVAARDLPSAPERIRDVAERPGAGAAGGLAFGLEAFLGARLVRGTDWVLRRVGFDEALERTDVAVTGEGAWDDTSASGKVTGEVLRRAREQGVSAVLVCGRIDGELPPGVVGGDGGGVRLDAEGLAAATRRAMLGGAAPRTPDGRRD